MFVPIESAAGAVVAASGFFEAPPASTTATTSFASGLLIGAGLSGGGGRKREEGERERGDRAKKEKNMLLREQNFLFLPRPELAFLRSARAIPHHHTHSALGGERGKKRGLESFARELRRSQFVFFLERCRKK